MHIVLIEPEIPPNTGNIARLCVGTGSTLHLVGKLGFSLDEKSVRRAGLDYWGFLKLELHKDVNNFLDTLDDSKIFFFSKKGKNIYTKANYKKDSFLIFGSETKGLSSEILKKYYDKTYYIPQTKNVRSLNLANAVSIVLYEALKKFEFAF
jgi:tRNA (cytidine/uridine-2'-O-)-methyltransferase